MKKLLLSMLALMMGFSITMQAQNASVAGGGEAAGANGKMSFTVGQVAYQFVSNNAKIYNEGVQQAHQENHLIINTIISGLGEVENKDYNNFVKVDFNSDTMYHIVPVEGWHVASVLVNGTPFRHISYYQFENIKEDQTIDVTFEIDQYNLTASKIGNGTITDEGVKTVTYDNSISYPYTITPDEGYSIIAIVVNNKPIDLTGIDVEKPYTYTFNNVLGDSTIVAMFGKNQYAIVATANENGMLTPNGSLLANYGEDYAYVAKANVGYFIEKVTIDGEVNEYTQADGKTTYEYTFEDVVANHTLDVQFAVCNYEVVATQGDNGKITPDGTKTYEYGKSPIYTIVPNTGYEIADVLVDDNSVGAVESYTFSNIKENHTITAKFNQLTYNIVASTSANGTITPAGTSKVNYNANMTYTMKADEGYEVSDVLVDGNSVGKVTTYTFKNVVENHTISVAYAAKVFDIVAKASEGGVVTPAGTTQVSYGKSQSYDIVANTGYTLTALKVDNKDVDLNTVVLPYVFENVAANHTLEAVFTINQYTIRASAGDGGTITPSGVKTLNYGETQAYTMKANDGFYIDYVMVDGVKVGPKETYEFKNVADNHTIEVAFLAEVCDKPTNTMTINITDNSAKFVWRGFADKYTVQYRMANDSVVGFTVVENITDLFYEVSNLTEATDYIWNVTGYCTYGDTLIASECAEESFTTLKTDRTGIQENALASIKVYANNDKVYIDNDQNIAVKNVEIFDMNGKVVYFGGALQSTHTEIPMSVAAGQYMVRLISNSNETSSYKVILTNF